MTPEALAMLLAATAVVCAATGYLLGALSAGSKLADQSREIVQLEDQRDTLDYKVEMLTLDNQELRTRLDRATRRPEVA